MTGDEKNLRFLANKSLHLNNGVRQEVVHWLLIAIKFNDLG